MSDPAHGTTAMYNRERKLGETCEACRRANSEAVRDRRARARAVPAVDAPTAWCEAPEGSIIFLSAAPASGSRWNIEVSALTEGRELFLMFGAVENLQTHEVLGRILELVRLFRVKVAVLHHDDLVFLNRDQDFGNKMMRADARVFHVNQDVDPEDLREGARATLLAVDQSLRHAPQNNPYVAEKRGQLELGAPGLDHLLADALATQNLGAIGYTNRVRQTRGALDAELAGHRVQRAVVGRGRLLKVGNFVQDGVEYEPIPHDDPRARQESWAVTGGGR